MEFSNLVMCFVVTLLYLFVPINQTTFYTILALYFITNISWYITTYNFKELIKHLKKR